MRLICCILIAALGSGCLVLSALAHSEYVFGPGDYLIYSTVLDTWFAHDLTRITLIRDRTALGIPKESLEAELAYVASQLLGVRPDTINDFKGKNIQTYALESFITQRAAYTIVPEAEINALFSYPDGWGRFYQHYPDSDGLLVFSRVGFSMHGGQALVYVANQWNNFSGAGLYVLLNKADDGAWEISQTVRVWHSWLPEEEVSPEVEPTTYHKLVP